jgi:hypothetical protein
MQLTSLSSGARWTISYLGGATMAGRLCCSIRTGACVLVAGCSVTRAVPVTPDAVSLTSYLAEHPATNLRVTERSGRKYWVHSPEVRGDSLVGRRGYDVPVRLLSVGLDDVVELHTSHFSAGRTAGVVGGVLAAAGVALALVIEEAQPIY